MAICYHLRKIVDIVSGGNLPLILIENAIFIIVFALTGSAFLSIIMTETRKQAIYPKKGRNI